jgi:hypothetical protein
MTWAATTEPRPRASLAADQRGGHAWHEWKDVTERWRLSTVEKEASA